MKSKTEYDRFDGLTRAILNVPHGEIQSKLAEEKQEKEQAKKRKKSKKYSASREESGRA